MIELLLPYAMIAGWIGFAMLVLGFALVVMGWARPKGFIYPFTMVLASAFYGVMNYSLSVTPGLWANVFFLIVAGVACLAALGRRKKDVTDEELDALSDAIEEES